MMMNQLVPHQDRNKEAKKNEWEPYIDNAGTCLGFTGEDYCVIAADTRCSNDSYQILSRHVTKITKVTDKIVLATGGMRADYCTLHKRINYQAEMFRYKNKKEISLSGCARLLSNILYNNRFFPIYAFCLLGGIDEIGQPVLYSYDAIGSYGKSKVGAVGSGGELVEPLLDSIILRHHRQASVVPTISNEELPTTRGEDGKPIIPKGIAIEYAHQALVAASERDIHTGDFAEIYVITKEGVERHMRELKAD
ncbi:putative Proteasome subunit beta type-1 [Blattamonas nauphoetae]|uniref:Proteasome subunit beta n=1 Tax=Blattamonas nauphoetae TaxID=2049346 RepID=A0ABQ9YET3_9EUKA|nr:putative Proteasome subunit beta type-1 [Blattamonas nauphoetae]